MKIQCGNIDEVVAGFNWAKSIFCATGRMVEWRAADLIWIVSHFEIPKSTIEHYLLVISKAAVKELLGIDVEIKIVIMLVAGYLFLAKKSLFHNQFIERLKNLVPRHDRQYEHVYN